MVGDKSSSEDIAIIAQYVADIFQGNGSKKVYNGLVAAIWCNSAIQCPHLDDNGYTRSAGLCKKHIGDYLDSRRVDRSKYNKDYSLALRQFEDKNLEAGIDILWSRLKEMSWEKDVSRPEDMSKPKDMEGEFVTFKELHWQIKYLGESLREVVEGQKN
jgi:hypothetical protein